MAAATECVVCAPAAGTKHGDALVARCNLCTVDMLSSGGGGGGDDASVQGPALDQSLLFCEFVMAQASIDRPFAGCADAHVDPGAPA